jgi:adenosylcobinamide hydrolase
MTDTLLVPRVFLRQDASALHVFSDAPLTVLSSAVAGGELTQARHLLNWRVPANYDCGDPLNDLRATAQALGIQEPYVGLLTAVPMERAQVVFEPEENATVAVVVTVGIGHATSAGVSPAAGPSNPTGTINVILVIDGRLPPAARVNAVITATEAKSLALVEAGIRASHGGLASGTGTDAIIVATTERGAYHEYAGPISPLGALIGRAVRRAIQSALALRADGPAA